MATFYPGTSIQATLLKDHYGADALIYVDGNLAGDISSNAPNLEAFNACQTISGGVTQLPSGQHVVNLVNNPTTGNSQIVAVYFVSFM